MHAYIVMRNHFHFALETPEPNSVAGMHWLQSTFAVRLLRFHGQLCMGKPGSVCAYVHTARPGVVGRD
jgi:hypothetical protein